MSEWANRVIGSPIWERLASARTQVDQIELASEDPPEAAADLIRLKTVINSVESRLKATDPLLLYPGPLGSLETHLQQLTSEMSSFQTSRNRGHLINANGQADSVLAYAAQLTATMSDSSEIPASLEVVRQRSEQILSALTGEERILHDDLAKLEQEVQKTTQEVSLQRARLDSAIAEYQQQFSVAESSRQNLAAEALSAHSQRLDQALTDARKQVQDSVLEASKRLEAMLQEANSKTTSQQAALQQSGEALLIRLEEYRSKAENLLHVIGSTGMAGEYQKAANAARAGAIVWQIIAGASMIGLIVFAVLAYSGTQVAQVQWTSVAGRVFVTVTFGILSAYAARQADRYADVELANRRYQLELSSIDPYLANLSEDTRHKVKVELAQKLFGNVSDSISAKPKEFSGSGKDSMELALSTLLELIRKRG